jgi:hypothetical protein
MTFGIGRGFNRLFLVLTVGWAIYCAVVYPLQHQWEGQNEALVKYWNDNKNCDQLIKEAPEEWSLTQDCYEQSTTDLQSRLKFFSFRNFWMLDAAFWKLLIPAMLLPPFIVYATAAIGQWVWKGFNAPSKG